MLSFLCSFLLLFSFSSVHAAFSFTSSPPTQCDNLSLSWIGGIAPFQLLMTPVFGTPRNVSIPAEAFQGGKGSYSIQLPFAQNQKILFTMSDATGFASGGSTAVLTVGPSQGGSCNFKDPGVDFSYELNTALQQCRPYTVSGYDGAIQPITFMGIVPSGTSFSITPPAGPANFIWNADVAAGTSIIFIMIDSSGRMGGSSDVKTVGITDDSTCLNNLSPSSTSANPSSMPTSSSGVTATSEASTPSSSSTSPSSNGVSIAAIAGTVIGALIFLAVAITLGLFFLRRKRDSSGPGFRRHSRRVDLTYEAQSGADGYTSMAGLAASSQSVLAASSPYLDAPAQQTAAYQYSNSQYQLPSQYQSSSQYQFPSQYQSPSQYHLPSQHQPRSEYQPYPPSLTGSDPFNPYSNESPAPSGISPFTLTSSDRQSARDSNATSRKGMTGLAYQPSRFIIHTDAEDDIPGPNEDGIVELPPQYSERRGPAPNFQSDVKNPNLYQSHDGETPGGSSSTS